VTTVLGYLGSMAVVIILGPLIPDLTLPPIAILLAFAYMALQDKTE
jgi:hypothetical protein